MSIGAALFALTSCGEGARSTDARAWIAGYYIERQNAAAADVNIAFSGEFYVPPAYADRVADCVVTTIDANPTNVGGRGQNVGRNWRDDISLVNDVRLGNTSNYTEDELQRGRVLDATILGETMLCRNRLIPTGVFEAEYEAWRLIPQCRAYRSEFDRFDPADGYSMHIRHVESFLQQACHQDVSLPTLSSGPQVSCDAGRRIAEEYNRNVRSPSGASATVDENCVPVLADGSSVEQLLRNWCASNNGEYESQTGRCKAT